MTAALPCACLVCDGLGLIRVQEVDHPAWSVGPGWVVQECVACKGSGSLVGGAA